MELLVLIGSLVFSNNLIMSVVKYLSVVKDSKVWLRGTLALLSVAGVIASASITGNPIDPNQLTELGKLVIEAAVVFVGSHYSYRAIKEA